VIALCWWYAADQEEGHITRTPAEVDAVLDTIAGMSREDWPVLAEVTQADVDDLRGPMLGVGLHVDRGMLWYSGPDNLRGSCSHGDAPVDGEPIDYMVGNSNTEMPADCEIPADIVRRAVHEFAENARRPTEVPWQPIS
jgi:immunity protein Imm1 of predicted polymorphic toxin system